jgi:rod shape determining protein RodA
MEKFLTFIGSRKAHIDWWLVSACIVITAFGIMTMYSFTDDNNLATRQIIWSLISLLVFFGASKIDFRFLRLTSVVVSIFVFITIILGLLFILGKVTNGATSWLSLGFFYFQPVDMAKLVLIIVLAKYFSRRHIEIAHWKHLVVSGIYAFILFALVIVQPDFGSAMILLFIWGGLILVSGISRKHVILLMALAGIAFFILWNFSFAEYQKARIINFLNPMYDIRGSGYNAYQSSIAVGSGGLWGKGIGYGTQSRLKFLPEYQTDFIFAAFAEEWGFFGIVILLTLYGIIIWRIIRYTSRGSTNFEILFGAGVAVFLLAHITINIGMNMQLLPVTGIPLPFMSYGGSHLLTEFLALGIIVAMSRYGRSTHKDMMRNEFVGVE